MSSPEDVSPYATLAGKSIAVWGLGREGIASLEALAGIPVAGLVVVDDQPREHTTTDGRRFVARAGAEGDAALVAADVVLKSPGISRYDPRAVAATAAGRTLSSGTALWMSAHHAATVGVTGSKGKSTTSSLISHLMSRLGLPNVYGGNIGLPLIALPAAERYVVELSSYQCSDLLHSPRIVALTSLFPEHLNWHGSEERYYSDKLNIAAHGPTSVVYNARDAVLSEHVTRLVAADVLVPAVVPDGFDVTSEPGGWRITRHGKGLLDHTATRLRGLHNAGNICVALAALEALGIDVAARAADVTAALREFEPLEHRLSTVDDPSQLTFVDDSLSTAPRAAIAAMEAFPDGPLAVILGGQDRGVSYRELRDYLAGVRRPVLALGVPDSGPRILDELAGLPAVTCWVVADISEAVAVARRELPAPGTVLLSPAAPSYGRYQDFAARGAAFRDAVRATA